MTVTETIILVDCNIKSFPELPLAQAESDINRVFSFESHIVTGAEIVRDFRGFWRTASRKAGKAVYGASQENPVSVCHSFKVHRSAVEFLTKGVARITPARFQTRVKLTTVNGFKVAVLAKHTVSGVDNPHAVRHFLRTVIAAQDKIKTQRRVRALLKRGFTVFISGDLNSRAPLRYHPDQIQVSNLGLMQVAVVPAKGIRARPLLTVGHRKGLHTDHPVVINHVELGRDQ